MADGPSGNEIYRDYLFDFEQVADFYEYNPRKEAAFTARDRYLKANYRHDNRAKLTNSLKKYNRKLGCSEKTIRSIELLKNKETKTVVTGQQPGILTGPLYTIYKAITAILLAEKASEITKTEVVPIFWVASEDHDFQEINNLHLINSENELDTIELTGDYIATSSGDIPVGEGVFKVIDNLAEKTYDTEFKEKIISDLSSWAKEANNLAEWFSRTMLKLFADYGLIIFDPMWTEIRELSTGIYQDIIRNQSQLKKSFRRTNEKLKEIGYSQQIDKEESNSHLFVYLEGERNSLLSNNDKFWTRNQKLTLEESGLLKKVTTDPECFSPNVVLRPIVQNYLLPTLAYVGGPGEIAYHAQLKDLYSIFDLEMPVLYPRESITIVEAKLAGYMEKYGIKREDIINHKLDRRLEEELAAKDKLDIPRTFAEIKEEFTGEYRELITKIKDIDKNLEKLGEQNLNRIIGQVEYLEEKTEQFHKRNNKILVRQFKKLKNNLLPRENLQERVLNIFPYLIKYDYKLIADLINYFDLSFKHRLYYRGDDDDS